MVSAQLLFEPAVPSEGVYVLGYNPTDHALRTFNVEPSTMAIGARSPERTAPNTNAQYGMLCGRLCFQPSATTATQSGSDTSR